MKYNCLHDRQQIEQFLRKNPERHFYELGDLDDFFWKYTVWYGFMENEHIRQIILFYTGLDVPVILGFAQEPLSTYQELLRSILHLLPYRFYIHISLNCIDILRDHYHVEPHGKFDQMVFHDKDISSSLDISEVERLSQIDAQELRALYQASYPGNWFDARMLDTNCYFGIRRDGRIVSAAGVHVYSPQYKAAALGNIVTHPRYRRQGLAGRVCARLCVELSDFDIVGLNVRSDNHAAITCYQGLGFKRVGSYEEFMLNRL